MMKIHRRRLLLNRHLPALRAFPMIVPARHKLIWLWSAFSLCKICLAQRNRLNQFMLEQEVQNRGLLMLSVTRVAIVVAESQWPYYSKWLWPFGYLANQHKTLFCGPSSTKPGQTNARCGSFKEGFAKIPPKKCLRVWVCWTILG